MDDEDGSCSARRRDSEVPFSLIAAAVADLPFVPVLAIAGRRLPITKDSSPAEVRDMLVILKSYMTRWLIPALELRVNPFAGAAAVSLSHGAKDGGLGELRRAITLLRPGS
jgi:hypothetical protein